MSSIANSIELIYAELAKTAAAADSPKAVQTSPDAVPNTYAPELSVLLKTAAEYAQSYSSDVSVGDVLNLVYGSQRGSDGVVEYALKTAAKGGVADALFKGVRNLNQKVTSKAAPPGPMPAASVQLPPPNLPHLTPAAPTKVAPPAAGAGPPPGVPKGAVQPPNPRTPPDPDVLRAVDNVLGGSAGAPSASAGASAVKAPNASITSRPSTPPRAFAEAPDDTIQRMEARLQQDMSRSKAVPTLLGQEAPPSRSVDIPDDIDITPPRNVSGGAASNSGPPPKGDTSGAASSSVPDADVDAGDIDDLTKGGRGWKLPLGLAAAGTIGTAGAYNYGKSEAAEEARRNRNLAFGAGMATGVAAPKIISRAGQAMSNFGGQGAQPGYYY